MAQAFLPLIMSAVAQVAISYAQRALFPVEQPDLGSKEDPTYGWGGIVTTARLGTPKPVNYGRMRVGGHNVMTYYDIKYQPIATDISKFWVAGILDSSITLALKGLFKARLDVSVAGGICLFPVSNVTLTITVPAGGAAFGCMFVWSADNPSPLSLNNWEIRSALPWLVERSIAFDFTGKTGIVMCAVVTTFDLDWEDVSVTGSIMPVPVPYIGLQERTDQYANVLLALGEGQIEDITDVEVNNQPITRYTDVTITKKLGGNTSGFPTWDKFLPSWYTTLKFKPVDRDTFEWSGNEPDGSGHIAFPDGSSYKVSRGYYNLGTGQYVTIYWDPYYSGQIRIAATIAEWVSASIRTGVTWLGCAYRLPFGFDEFFDTNCFVFVANQITGFNNSQFQLPNLGPVANFQDVYNTYTWQRKLEYNKTILEYAYKYPFAPVDVVSQDPIVDDAIAVYETEDSVNAIAIGLKCPNGLYHMSKKGKMKNNSTYFAVWWRRLNPSETPPHGMWHPLSNFGALVAVPLAIVYYYMTGESLTSYANQFNLMSFFTFIITENTNNPVYRELRIDFPKGELVDRLLYPWASMFNAPEPGGRGKFQIMITKTGPDSTDAADQNELWVDYVKEIRYDDIQYVNTALLGVKIKATDQLSGGVPSVTAVVHGIQVRIFRSLNSSGAPVFSTSSAGTNYQWSNNPVYCLYDLITNERYGLGKYLATENIDHESFLEAAEYCDEPVIDGYEYTTGYLKMTQNSAEVTGYGTNFEDAHFKPLQCFAKNLSIKISGDNTSYGIESFNDAFYEPPTPGVRTQKFYLDRVYTGTGGYKQYVMNNKRFTFNASLDAQSGAMDAIANICGTFNCIPYWSGGALKLKIEKVVDKDSDGNPLPVQIFNMGNIIRNDDTTSTFSVQFTPLKELPNYIEVTYLNEDDSWETHAVIKYDPSVTDDPSVEVRKLSVQAIGVTRENQAKRLANYLSNYYKYSTKIISFRVDSDAIACEPGDIVEVQHDMPNWHYGGRVVSSTSSTVTVDEVLTSYVSYEYVIRIQHYDSASKEMKFQQRYVAYINDNIITIVGTWDYPPSEHDVYIYAKIQGESDYLKTHNLFRVASIQREEDTTFTITATEYNDSIYDESLYVPNVSSDFTDPRWPYDEDPPNAIPADVTGLTLTQSLDREGIIIGYTVPRDNIWHHANIYARLEDSEYKLVMSTSTVPTYMSTDTGNTYYIKVISYSATGIAGINPPEASIYTTPPPPPDVTGLKLSGYPDGTTEFTSLFFAIEWNDVSYTAIGETSEDDDGNITASTQHQYNYHIILECLDFNPLRVVLGWFPLAKKNEWYQANTFFNINVLSPIKIGRRFRVSVWARSLTSGTESANAAVLELQNSAPDMSGILPQITIRRGVLGMIYWNVDWSAYNEPDDLLYYRVFCDADSTVQNLIPCATLLPGQKSHEFNLLDTIASGTMARDFFQNFVIGDNVYFQVIPYDIFGEGIGSQVKERSSGDEPDIDPPPDIPAKPDVPTIGAITKSYYGNRYSGRTVTASVVISILTTQQIDYIETWIQRTDSSVKINVQTLYAIPGTAIYNVSFKNLESNTDYTICARSHNASWWSDTAEKSFNSSHDILSGPAIPTNLRISTGIGMIFLEWDCEDDDLDIHHYDIYSSDQNDSSTATKIGSTANIVRIFSYNIESGTLMYYWVKSVDLDGNESNFSSSIHGSARFIEGIDFGDYTLLPSFIDQAINTWTTSITFDSDAGNTVSWTAGYIYFDNGKTYNISSSGGNKTIADNQSLFIYLDINVSETEFQTSSEIWSFIGSGKTLICRAVYTSASASDQAMLNPGVVQGLFTAANIAANSIVSDKIAANAITVGKINAGAVDTNELAAGAVTATKIDVTSLSAINANCGTITAGTLRDASSTFIIDLSNATFTVTTNDGIRIRTSGGLKIQNAGGTTTYVETTSAGIQLNTGADLTCNSGSTINIGTASSGSGIIFTSQANITSASGSLSIHPYSANTKTLNIGSEANSWNGINFAFNDSDFVVESWGDGIIKLLPLSGNTTSQIYMRLPDSVDGSAKTLRSIWRDSSGYIRGG